MRGAIVSDIMSSDSEHEPIERRDFPLFDPGCQFMVLNREGHRK